MNHINVRYVKTCHNDYEYYWIIDGRPITVYLERNQTNSLSVFGPLLDYSLRGAESSYGSVKMTLYGKWLTVRKN